jgi:hypothetical protein
LPKYFPGSIESDDLSELQVNAPVVLADALAVTAVVGVGVAVGDDAVLALEPHAANRNTATIKMTDTTRPRSAGL